MAMRYLPSLAAPAEAVRHLLTWARRVKTTGVEISGCKGSIGHVLLAGSVCDSESIEVKESKCSAPVRLSALRLHTESGEWHCGITQRHRDGTQPSTT